VAFAALTFLENRVLCGSAHVKKHDQFYKIASRFARRNYSSRLANATYNNPVDKGRLLREGACVACFEGGSCTVSRRHHQDLMMTEQVDKSRNMGHPPEGDQAIASDDEADKKAADIWPGRRPGSGGIVLSCAKQVFLTGIGMDPFAMRGKVVRFIFRDLTAASCALTERWRMLDEDVEKTILDSDEYKGEYEDGIPALKAAEKDSALFIIGHYEDGAVHEWAAAVHTMEECMDALQQHALACSLTQYKLQVDWGKVQWDKVKDKIIARLIAERPPPGAEEGMEDT
jgi:hypothetical protein